MRILVTGGAGYLGSTLVPMLLSAGHCVRVLDNLMYGGESLLGVWSNPDFEFIRGDIRDVAAVRKAVADCNAVVHLAAIVGDPACAREPVLAEQINLEAPKNILHESRRSGVERLVFASTCSNYGKMPDPNHFVDEESELTPISLYARTKVAFEKILFDPAQTLPVCGTALRFATIFGVSPRMRFDLTVNEFTMELANRKRLTVFGEQFWRPYVHVRDASRAILAVLQAPKEKVQQAVFNVGANDQNFRKKQLVEMILPHVPGATIEYVHKDEDPRDYRVSFEKIANILDYQRTRTVEDGIAEVLTLVRSGAISNYEDPKYRNI